MPAVALVVLLGALTACAGGEERVHGLLVDVQSSGLLELDSIDLIDDEGNRWTLDGSGTFGDLTPSHLRQHMVLGERVEATFHREGDRLVMDRLVDYP